jgi:hypothetical protein
MMCSDRDLRSVADCPQLTWLWQPKVAGAARGRCAAASAGERYVRRKGALGLLWDARRSRSLNAYQLRMRDPRYPSDIEEDDNGIPAIPRY